MASTLAYCSSTCAREALPAQSANALALLVTAVANTAANRRLTFGVRGPAGACATSPRASSSSPWASP